MNKPRLDLTINISNIVALIILIGTIASYATKAISYLAAVDNKVSIMWIDFAKSHPDAERQLEAVSHRN